MTAFDVNEIIKRDVREEAARHEALHEKLSKAVGPIETYREMTTPELAKYGLEKLRRPVPDDSDHPAVAALEAILHGRSDQMGGGVGGMDAAPTFIDAYLAT
jgi:hypothetical protein